MAEVDRCRVYEVAPVTAFQPTEIDCEPVAVAASPVGTPDRVVAETDEENDVLPLPLVAHTS